MSRAGERGRSSAKVPKVSRPGDEEANERVLKKFDKIYERTKDRPTRLGELFRLHKEHHAKRASREASDNQD